MAEISIDESTLQMLVLCSFRYALGRRTYIVYEAASWVERWWHHLPSGYQQLIKQEINDAIEHGCAGDECDVKRWENVLKLSLR